MYIYMYIYDPRVYDPSVRVRERERERARDTQRQTVSVLGCRASNGGVSKIQAKVRIDCTSRSLQRGSWRAVLLVYATLH